MSLWNELQASSTCCIRPNIICNGTSIWLSTDYDEGERGMIEYDTKSHRIISVTKYPKDIQPDIHSLCLYNNLIYIIDGEHGKIYTFDPVQKRFQLKLNINPLGVFTNCIATDNGIIYIFNGDKNVGYYYIYSTKSNTIKSVRDTHKYSTLVEQCTISTDNKLFRIGGISQNYKFMCDSVYSAASHNVAWSEEFKLPRGLCGFGLIYYKKYIIIFGGCYKPKQYLNHIYVFNLQNKIASWKRLEHLKCPLQNKYHAILMADNNVHLFTMPNASKNIKPKHFSIPISYIVPEVNDAVDHDEKCDNCDTLKEELLLLKTMHKSEVDSLKEQIKIQSEKNNELNDEVKECKMELMEVKKELNELKKKCIDVSRYNEWSSDEFVNWICSLDDGKYEKYENKLRNIFIEEDISGEAIPHIQKNEWKEWGITSYMDRTNLDKHLKNLLNQNNKKQSVYDKEGSDATPYI
eukprot:494890_1